MTPDTRPAAPPDFLCIGAQKAGTTWLYRNLRRHPDVWLPPEKELHVFDERLGEPAHRLRDRLRGQGGRDVRWRRQLRRQLRKYGKRHLDDPLLDSVRWDLRYFFGRPNAGWYASLFAPAAGRVSGDVTPNYSVLPEQRIEEVARVVPDARIIFLLRNPIERTWSMAMMGARMAGDAGDDVVARTLTSARSDGHNDYLGAIARWEAAFGADRLFVGFTEDIAFAPEELLDRICRFLDVEPLDRYPAARRVIHTGANTTMPADHARRIAADQHDLLEALSAGLGHYADWWRWVGLRLERLEDARPLAYPLWQGPLFDEWLDGSREQIHAAGAVLSALRERGAA